MIAREGDRAAWRFIEFFTANIRNPNTRRAYARAVGDFFRWCEQRRVRDVAQISPTLVAAYVEHRGRTHAKPTVKQELAAVRMLFDWLVVGHVLDASPAHAAVSAEALAKAGPPSFAEATEGKKHVIKRGKTPVLTREETRELLDAIQTDDIASLRDRALIGLLVFSFARIGAALTLKVDLSAEASAKADYFPEGKRWKLRLHEKGGKEHVVPVHHVLEEYLDAYLDAANIRDQAGGPLFRTLVTARGRPLSLKPMRQSDAWRMTCGT